MIHWIVTTFGFAESQAMSETVWRCEGDIDGPPIVALQHFIESVKAIYVEDVVENEILQRKNCCKNLQENKGFDFCPRCGRKLRNEFDEEEFINWWHQLVTTGELNEWHGTDRIHWEPWGFSGILHPKVQKDEILVIENSMEKVIAEVLDDDDRKALKKKIKKKKSQGWYSLAYY